MNIESRVMQTICNLSMASFEDVELEEKLVILGIDSLKKVELIINLEEIFGIVFDDAELDPTKLISVKDIVELTQNAINKKCGNI